MRQALAIARRRAHAARSPRRARSRIVVVVDVDAGVDLTSRDAVWHCAVSSGFACAAAAAAASRMQHSGTKSSSSCCMPQYSPSASIASSRSYPAASSRTGTRLCVVVSHPHTCTDRRDRSRARCFHATVTAHLLDSMRMRHRVVVKGSISGRIAAIRLRLLQRRDAVLPHVHATAR
jgi:hypothetical protein